MPDQFGQETPQEAIARVRQSFVDQQVRFAESPLATTSGGQAGQALANIFGGAIKRRLDTRRARQSEAARLVEETGISQQDARELAKQNIPLQHAEVRKASRMSKAAGEARKLIEERTPIDGPVIAQAKGMILQAQKLREMGFHTEASTMTLEAVKIKNNEQERLLEVEKVKAATAASRAATALSTARLNEIGDTPFIDTVQKAEALREEITAKVDASADATEIESLERQLGHIDSQIEKLNAITGTTEYDPSSLSKAGKNKQAEKLIELNILFGKADEVERVLVENEGSLAATIWGRMTSRALGFMEDKFARLPSESEQDFMQRVTDIQGGSAFVSAQIRHALTGAAMSAAEVVYLEPFLPQPGDSLSQMLMKIRVVKKYTALDIAFRRELLENEISGNRFLETASRQATREIAREARARAAGTTDLPPPTGTRTEAIDETQSIIQDALATAGGG